MTDITKQVGEDLGEFVAITQTLRQHAIQLETKGMAWRGRTKKLKYFPDQGVQIHSLQGEQHPPRLHPFQVEQVSNHTAEPLGLGKDIGCILLDLFSTERLLTHQLTEPPDTGQCRAELMTDNRDKGALHLARMGKLLIGSLERFQRLLALTHAQGDLLGQEHQTLILSRHLPLKHLAGLLHRNEIGCPNPQLLWKEWLDQILLDALAQQLDAQGVIRPR